MKNNFFSYFLQQKKNQLELFYLNWQNFQCKLQTTNGLPISVDFGDGIIQNVPGNNTSFTYSKAVASDGFVKIFQADRLLRVAFNDNNSATHRVTWQFSLANFQPATNLESFDFRSGDIFGDVGLLAQGLKTFQITVFAYGILNNLSPCPSSLVSFNQPSQNTEYLFTTSQITAEMPLLENFIIAGKSKVVDDASFFPTNLKNIDIANVSNFGIDRKNEVIYSAPRVHPTGMTRFRITCANGLGFTTSMLNQFLEDAATTTWVSGALIDLRFGHGSRTASLTDGYVASLQAQGVSLLLNAAI